MSREEEKKGCGGNDLQKKEGFKPGMKEWENDGILLIIISIIVNARRALLVPGRVTHLRAGIPARYVTSQLEEGKEGGYVTV